MEVIAGRPDFETEVVQHGMRFRLDYSKASGPGGWQGGGRKGALPPRLLQGMQPENGGAAMSTTPPEYSDVA